MHTHGSVCVCVCVLMHTQQRRERDGVIGECEWMKGKEKEEHQEVGIHYTQMKFLPFPCLVSGCLPVGVTTSTPPDHQGSSWEGAWQ